MPTYTQVEIMPSNRKCLVTEYGDNDHCWFNPHLHYILRSLTPCFPSMPTNLSSYYVTYDKQTFPVLSHAMRQLTFDVKMSFDLGNPLRIFTDFWSSTFHMRTDPSHDDDAYNNMQKQITLDDTKIYILWQTYSTTTSCKR